MPEIRIIVQAMEGGRDVPLNCATNQPWEVQGIVVYMGEESKYCTLTRTAS